MNPNLIPLVVLGPFFLLMFVAFGGFYLYQNSNRGQVNQWKLARLSMENWVKSDAALPPDLHRLRAGIRRLLKEERLRESERLLEEARKNLLADEEDAATNTADASDSREDTGADDDLVDEEGIFGAPNTKKAEKKRP